jgi:hypothetical protein
MALDEVINNKVLAAMDLFTVPQKSIFISHLILGL